MKNNPTNQSFRSIMHPKACIIIMITMLFGQMPSFSQQKFMVSANFDHQIINNNFKNATYRSSNMSSTNFLGYHLNEHFTMGAGISVKMKKSTETSKEDLLGAVYTGNFFNDSVFYDVAEPEDFYLIQKGMRARYTIRPMLFAEYHRALLSQRLSIALQMYSGVDLSTVASMEKYFDGEHSRNSYADGRAFTMGLRPVLRLKLYKSAGLELSTEIMQYYHPVKEAKRYWDRQASGIYYGFHPKNWQIGVFVGF
jgi:hypothetical protein